MNRTPRTTRNALLQAMTLAIALVLAVINPLTEIATSYNREAALGGTAIYASLRGVISAMSFVRDADIQASVGVAAVSGSPGQALQPVISTLERLANLLFALVIASGVLSVGLPALTGLGAIVLALGAAGGLLATLLGRRWPPMLAAGAAACIRLGIIAAVLLPASYALAFLIGDRMTADAWSSAADVFNRQSVELSEAAGAALAPAPAPQPEAPAAPAEEGGILGWIGGAVDSVLRGSSEAIGGVVEATAGFATTLRDQIASNTMVITGGIAAAGELFEASVQIGVAYLVKLVVLPLAILFGAVWIGRALRPQPMMLVPPASPALERHRDLEAR